MQPSNTDFMVLDKEMLPYDGSLYEFEGFHYEDTQVSFILVEMRPGKGVRLHKHPYKEIFIIQEGTASFTVDSIEMTGRAGQIIIVPADTPHKFENTGDRTLRQVDIHVSREFITEWLEE